MVWGHRGHSHFLKPDHYSNPPYQNSMKAFEHALKYCMGLETDVIQSASGTAYLTHDTLFLDKVVYEMKKHLDEPSKILLGDRRIYQLSDTEAQQLKLLDGQNLATMRQLLELTQFYPQRVLNFELKGPHTTDVALKTVREAIKRGYVTPEQIVFSSFNLPQMAELRARVGNEFKLAAILSMKTQTKSLLFPEWENTPQDGFYTPFNPPEDVLQSDVIRKINPDYFHLERNSVTLQDIDLITKYYPAAKVGIWCIGEPHPDDDEQVVNVAATLAASGKLYAVMTDYPAEMQKHLIARNVPVKLQPL